MLTDTHTHDYILTQLVVIIVKYSKFLLNNFSDLNEKKNNRKKNNLIF